MELNDPSQDCVGGCRACVAVGSCADRVVCRCLKVTEQTVITAIVTLGLRTVREVRAATDAGNGCTCCHRELAAYLTVYAPAQATPSHSPASLPSSLEPICSVK